MKWIPMEWMTPDKTGAYLVTRKGGSPSVVIGHWEQPQGQLSFESDNKGRWKWMPQEIIAWMPLPEPYTADTPQTEECNACIVYDGDGNVIAEIGCEECPKIDCELK